MPIFNKNNKRVYLRRKSQRLQGYAFGGLFLLIGFLALDQFFKTSEDRGGQ